jgi:hypothetical protein
MNLKSITDKSTVINQYRGTPCELLKDTTCDILNCSLLKCHRVSERTGISIDPPEEFTSTTMISRLMGVKIK